VASIISNLVAAFKTDASELPPAVRFVPAPYLFIHAEALPDGMQPSEMEGFAGVTMEGLSPIPLEQLAWGYLANEKSRHLVIFGAFLERLNAENLSPEESFYHVLPSFFAAAPANGAAQWVFIWEAGHVSAAHYNAGEVIPTRIEIERLSEDTVAGAFAARENLLKRLGAHARGEAAPGLLAQPEGTRGPRDRMVYTFNRYDSADAQPVRVPGNAPGGLAERWSADMRGSIFRSAEQRRRSAAATAGLVLKLAAVCGVLLILVQGGVIYGQIVVKNKQTQISNQTNDVNLVTQRLSLLKQIDQFTGHELHPFEMIGAINLLRPKEIYYTKMRVYENNKLSVDCISISPNAIEDFVQSLDNTGYITVDKGKIVITSNPLAVPPQSKFTLNLIFSPVPAREEMPPRPPDPPPPGQEPPPEIFQPANPADATPPDANGAPTPPDNGAPVPEPAPVSGQTGPNIISSAPPEPAAPDPAAVPAPAPAADVPAPGQ
jgi:hypothetical protein